MRGLFPFTSQRDVFGRLRTSLGIFGNDCVVFKNPSTPRIKILRLYFRKSWQVYTWLITSELANQRMWKVLFTCVVYATQVLNTAKTTSLQYSIKNTNIANHRVWYHCNITRWDFFPYVTALEKLSALHSQIPPLNKAGSKAPCGQTPNSWCNNYIEGVILTRFLL